MTTQSGASLLWLIGINVHTYPTGDTQASFGIRRSARHKAMIDALQELMKIIERDLAARDESEAAVLAALTGFHLELTPSGMWVATLAGRQSDYSESPLAAAQAVLSVVLRQLAEYDEASQQDRLGE